MAEHDKSRELVESDEADAEGLKLGQQQGEALTRTLRHMTGDIAQTGDEVESGEYLIAFAIEKAEGMHVPEGGDLRWQEPGEENAHVEVAVRDAADGRFIPGLKVFVTITSGSGEEIGTHEHPLLWHPYLYHYGRNWKLPSSGRYDLKIAFDPPEFPRHDEKNGRRFLARGEVTFSGVGIETGQD